MVVARVLRDRPPPKRHYVPLIFVPGTRVRLLTEARKMPCLSWSLPARKSCPHSLPAGTPGAICGQCYAEKGRYRFANVQNAQAVRYEWAKRCMRTAEGRAEFIATMVAAIKRSRVAYFRVHDSGDFFSPWYVRCWAAIVRQLRSVRFWFPTRAHRALAAVGAMAEIWREALAELCGRRNAIVRPSADHFEDAAPIVPGFAAGSTASAEHFTCPASKQGNFCRSCRACWTRPDLAICYHKH